MFDLDREIAAWSATFARRCGREADMAELEDHLRSAFGQLSAGGMVPERAFELAVSRMGDVADIDAEYEKNRSPLARLHSRLARWDRSAARGSDQRRETSLDVILASLILAVSIVLADADISGSTAAIYLIILIGPLWVASRTLVRR